MDIDDSWCTNKFYINAESSSATITPNLDWTWVAQCIKTEVFPLKSTKHNTVYMLDILATSTHPYSDQYSLPIACWLAKNVIKSL